MAINRLKGLGNILYNVGNLPSSYREALSYEEQLLWLLNYLEKTVVPTVNECIDEVNKIDVDYQSVKNDIELMKESIENIYNIINSLSAEIYANVDAKLQQQYNQVVTLMNDYQTIFDNRLSLMYETLEHEIQEIQIGNVMAYDPTTGELAPVSIVIQNVYDATRQNAISCTEFDGLNLTCTQFENYQISAYNFDLNAKVILV